MDNDTKRKLWIGLPAIGAVAAAAAFGGPAAARRMRQNRPHDDAPGRTTYSSRFGKYDVSGNSVTINRPPRDGRMAFIRSPDGISVELLQKGDPLAPKEPWASAENIGVW